MQLNDTLDEYKQLLKKTSANRNDQLKRTNRGNRFLNKTIRFSTGQYAYVTNQGVAKYMPYQTDVTNAIQVIVPWDAAYEVPNTRIPTVPPLISGTPMTQGQATGYEGTNVYVDRMVTNATAEYQGCYADNKSMTFLGDASPSAMNGSGFVNGSFAHPSIKPNTFETITSESRIPGWSSKGAVLNYDSDAWGYPKRGGKSISLQKTASISQVIQDLSAGKYTLTFVACGRNNGSNPISVLINDAQVYSLTPPVNQWTKYTVPITIVNSGINKITFAGTWSSSDRSSAIDSVALDGDTSTGIYTYETCKQAAMDGGYKFFGLQDKGFCAVSNDEIGTTGGGISYAVTGGTPLWSSNTKQETSGQATNYVATLTSTGSLSVLNSSQIPISDTPVQNPTNYLGCYGDKSARAMPLYNGGSQSYDHDKCRDMAEQQNKKYYGLQNSTSGSNAQCVLSDDILQVRKYGKAGNCTKLSSGLFSGGGWSNAVYTRDPEEKNNYYLILQDDGNMCVYRGSNSGSNSSSGSDNQGAIWCSMTNGKAQKPNPRYTAAKCKFGKNWLSSGDTLATNEFIGSNDGSIYLMMQSDGNLVLYTSSNEINCSKTGDFYIGGQGANAVYKMDKVGDPSVLSKYGYIDENSGILRGEQRGATTNNVDSIHYNQYAKHIDIPDYMSEDDAKLAAMESRLKQQSTSLYNETTELKKRDMEVNATMDANTKRVQEKAALLKREGFQDYYLENSEIVLRQANYEYVVWSMLTISAALLALKYSRSSN